MINPTAINSEDQIYLANSPININIQNSNKDNNIQSALLYLYVWAGNLNAPPTSPTRTLSASKVSDKDTYINFELSQLILSEIKNTMFVWNVGAKEPMINGEVVFWQYRYQVINKNGTSESFIQSVSNLATSGYRNDFEQVGDTTSKKQPYLSILPINYNRNYNCNIKYFKREFDLTKTLTACTSLNAVKSTALNPTITQKPQGEKYLIVYLNRLGLFDYFTPFGRVQKSIKIDSEQNSQSYRNARVINASVAHLTKRIIDKTEQTYTINTGYLNEEMTEQVEELLFSPLIYLVNFSGSTFINAQIGVTVDSTVITVDSTLYTVDNDTVTNQDVDFYSDYRQMPVVNDNSDFEFKNRLNDKGKINYDLKFKVTTDRINNIR